MKKFVLLLLTMFVIITSYAQVTTSSISGKVIDDKGVPAVGAAVIAIHTSSGTEYGTVVDAKGNYRLPNLRPGGPYTIKFHLLGYKPAETSGIDLQLANNYVADKALKEEAMGIEAVVVAAKGKSNMNSDQAGAVTNINARSISILPTVSRSITDLTRLTPQANGASIGGGNYRQNFITIDGATFNNSFGIGQSLPANGSPISLDALEQISVNVTPYDVRQSGFLGAAINAVTRSGDNEFRGSAYTYLNNENYKGNKVGDVKLNRTPSKYNVYGVRFGGPIIKNKLFFFVSYENERSVLPGPARVASRPGAEYTDGLNNIARPSVSEMEGISKYLSDTYGYNPGAFEGYSAESPGSKILARIDWNIHKNHRFNIRYSSTKAKSPSNPSTSVSGLDSNQKPYAGTRNDMSAITFANARYFNETNFSSIAGELNSTFADGRFNNTLRVTYSKQNEPRSTEGGIFPFVDILKDGKPFTSFGTELFSYGNLRDVSTYSITDDFSWSMGNHNFIGGIQFEWNETKNGFQRFGTGYYVYNSWEDFTAGNKASSFAITHSNSPGFEQAFPSFKSKQLSFYLQDEMSLSDNFKLLAGIRLDMPFYPKTDTFNEVVSKTDIGGKFYDTSALPSTKVMFSPRVGFNYDIMGDRSLVLRGGTGIFTGRIPFVWIVGQAGDAGVLQTTYSKVSSTTTPTKVPDFHANISDILKDIYPNGAPGVGTVLPSAISVMSKDFKMPQTWKTSLALDARLPWGIMGTVEGIYNKDINGAVFNNAGLKDPKSWNVPGYPDNRLIYSLNDADKYYNRTLKNVYVIENGKGGYYWSLTAKLEKAFSQGFSAMIAYTHSEAKNISDGSGDQVASAWQNTPMVNGSNNRELSFANYVIPNKVIASVSYRREYLKSMATSIGIFYEGGSQGRFSYTYTKSISNDGSYSSLIYVPKDASEIDFIKQDIIVDKKVVDTWTPEQQSEAFFKFIEQDDYLKTRKGQYAERNGAKYPWVNTFDVKITQDFFVNVRGKRNTIQIGLDIMNVGNLLNKNWGNRYYAYTNNQNSILVPVDPKTTDGVRPTFKFNPNGTKMFTDSYSKYFGYSSTYSMQLSFRYIFN